MDECKTRSRPRITSHQRRVVEQALRHGYYLSDQDIVDAIQRETGISVSRALVNRVRHGLEHAREGAIPPRSYRGRKVNADLANPHACAWCCGFPRATGEILCQFCIKREEEQQFAWARRTLRKRGIKDEATLRSLKRAKMLRGDGVGERLVWFIRSVLGSKDPTRIQRLFDDPVLGLTAEGGGGPPTGAAPAKRRRPSHGKKRRRPSHGKKTRPGAHARKARREPSRA